MSKEILFSVTASDCRFDYYRGSGNGGQARNKRDTAVRCTHIASGAVGTAEDYRGQLENKRAAFVRMANTKEFKIWHKLEVSRRLGRLRGIEEEVERQMRNTKCEMKDENGRWVPYSESDATKEE